MLGTVHRRYVNLVVPPLKPYMYHPKTARWWEVLFYWIFREKQAMCLEKKKAKVCNGSGILF